MPVLRQPPRPLVDAFQRAASPGSGSETATVLEGGDALPIVRDGDRVFVLADPGEDFKTTALSDGWAYEPPPGTAEVWVALGRGAVGAPVTVQLGVRAKVAGVTLGVREAVWPHGGLLRFRLCGRWRLQGAL